MEEWSIPELSLWDLVPFWEREPEHNYVHLVQNEHPEYQYYIQGACSRPWCAVCEKQRLWRYRNRIAAYLEYNRGLGVNCWWFLTRSIRNSHSVRSAFVEFSIVRRAFHQNAARWAPHPWHKVRAFIGVMEMTYSPETGYNLHQHMLVGATFWNRLDPELIGLYWSKYPARAGWGRKSNSHMPRMNHDVGAVAYLTKYISKGAWGGLSRGRVYMIREELKGRNRIQVMVRTSPSAVPKHGFLMCCVTAEDGSCQRDVVDDIVLPGYQYDPDVSDL